MSAITATALADILPSSVPKLEASGLNWMIFSLHFQDAVEAKGYWGHFDGTTPRPIVAKPEDAPTAAKTTETTATQSVASSAEELAAVAQWDKDERSAKSLLIQKIPDSVLMKLWNKKSVLERWDTIVREYTEKGTFAQTELRNCFLEMKCPDNGDVRQYLDDLHVKREELVTMGVEIDEKDYRSTIISSLPIHLSNFTLNQLSVARLYAPTKTIDPDALISLIAEESEHQHSQRAHRGNGSGKVKNDDKDEALSVTQGQSSRGKGGPRRFPRGVCWNCGEKGHFKDKCLKPAKKDSNSPKNSGTANAAIASDSEGEGAFFMEPESDEDSDFDDEPVGEHKGDSEDWFLEAGEDVADSSWDTEELSRIDWSECGSLVDVYLDSDTVEPDEITAQVSAGNANAPRAEIYDFGCSKHLTPYQDVLKNFVDIPPKSFCATNKQKMSAVGMGEMTIDIPNGTDVSKLRLMEVLYSPDMGYTLVSVRKLDDKGFKLTFLGRRCMIHGPMGEHIGAIPKARQGLYRVAHEEPIAANLAKEVLTLDQFHR